MDKHAILDKNISIQVNISNDNISNELIYGLLNEGYEVSSRSLV